MHQLGFEFRMPLLFEMPRDSSQDIALCFLGLQEQVRLIGGDFEMLDNAIVSVQSLVDGDLVVKRQAIDTVGFSHLCIATLITELGDFDDPVI